MNPHDLWNADDFQQHLIHEPINTQLINAIFANNFECVQDLVEHQGADVQYRQNMPIHYATQTGNIALVDYLIARGAYISTRGSLSMVLASRRGDYDMIVYLANLGMRPDNDLAFRQALDNGFDNIAEFLVRLEPDRYLNSEFARRVVAETADTIRGIRPLDENMPYDALWSDRYLDYLYEPNTISAYRQHERASRRRSP